MTHWFTRGQVWQKYKLSVLLADLADKGKTLIQAAGFVYFVREYCIELSVVSEDKVISKFSMCTACFGVIKEI